jgi:MFS family permease
MSGTARYVAILRTPHVAPLLLASMLARLPFGLYALAVVLYLAEARDSYAVAGLVDGAFGIGAAIGVPVQSRLIDRFGHRRVLLPLAIVDASSTLLLIALTEADAPTIALVLCALVGGFAVPAIGSAMRALWPELLRRRDELLSTAFALDGVSIELLFTVGPLLSALIIALVSPIAALLLSAACALTGTILFVTRKPSREWTPDADAGTHGLLGALRSPGVVTLALSAAPVGFCFGTVEISMPAFAEQFGAAEWAGVLLSVWAGASAVGGLAYGARHWRQPLPSVYVRIALLLPLGFLPALLAPSIAAMALLIIPAGLLIAPLGAAANQIVGTVAPAGAVTEAYSWPTTFLIAGFAAGTAVGGHLAEHVSWESCFVAAVAAASAGALIAIGRRATLNAAPVPAVP